MKGKFLVATYKYRPRNRAISHLKNAGETNMALDEEVHFLTSVPDKVMLNSSVILDLENQKVIRTKHGLDNNYERLYTYYYKEYQDHIDRFMKVE